MDQCWPNASLNLLGDLFVAAPFFSDSLLKKAGFQMESRSDTLSSQRANGAQDGGVTVIDAGAEQSFGVSDASPTVHADDKLFTRFLRWLYPNKRKADRHTFPPIVSYLGTHRTPPPFRVADVGIAGFYMLTIDRWLPGTEMPVTLQRIDAGRDRTMESITLLARVVRCGRDGVGFAFPLMDEGNPVAEPVPLTNRDSNPGWANRKDVERFLEGIEQSGLDFSQPKRESKPVRDDLPCFPQ